MMKTSDHQKSAQAFANLIRKNGMNVDAILLYGSVASGNTHEHSDIDIAIVCKPFAANRHEENMEFRRLRRSVDVRISPICLHPEDLENRYSTIAQEVKKMAFLFRILITVDWACVFFLLHS